MLIRASWRTTRTSKTIIHIRFVTQRAREKEGERESWYRGQLIPGHGNKNEQTRRQKRGQECKWKIYVGAKWRIEVGMEGHLFGGGTSPFVFARLRTEGKRHSVDPLRGKFTVRWQRKRGKEDKKKKRIAPEIPLCFRLSEAAPSATLSRFIRPSRNGTVPFFFFFISSKLYSFKVVSIRSVISVETANAVGGNNWTNDSEKLKIEIKLIKL